MNQLMFQKKVNSAPFFSCQMLRKTVDTCFIISQKIKLYTVSIKDNPFINTSPPKNKKQSHMHACTTEWGSSLSFTMNIM